MNLNFCLCRRTKIVGFLSSSILLACLSISPSLAEDANHGDVVVRKNSDGSVSTFDASDPAVNAAGPGSSPEVQVGVHGANKPYTRKHSDGVVVRRNADGSIETFSPEEVSSYTPSVRKSTKKRSKKRKSRKKTVRRSTKKKNVSTKKKSVKKPKKVKPLKRGSLLK